MGVGSEFVRWCNAHVCVCVRMCESLLMCPIVDGCIVLCCIALPFTDYPILRFSTQNSAAMARHSHDTTRAHLQVGRVEFGIGTRVILILQHHLHKSNIYIYI